MTRKKLTLSVDEAAIRRARRYSERHGTSVSELVSRFLSSLGEEPELESPLVSKLRGILPSDTSIDEYRHYIADKYGE